MSEQRHPNSNKKKYLIGCGSLLVLLLIIGIIFSPKSNSPRPVSTEHHAGEAKQKYFAVNDGLAIADFTWKQRDSSLHFDYSITYQNIGSSDIDGANMSYEFVYENGDSSGTYNFGFHIGSLYAKKSLKPGESFLENRHTGIPHSGNYHQKIREIILRINDVD
ncbi:MAG: hypothetical protein K1X90_12270 [Candidatus Kapabacteria bacterium]|nr:hypothetical protein [Candidatus Kapabacteria bacterium]